MPSRSAELPPIESVQPGSIVLAGAAGDQLPRIRKCFKDNQNWIVVRANSSEPATVLEECKAYLPCVLLMDVDSVLAIDRVVFARKVDFGRLVPVLVLANGESSSEMELLLRMGCMGVLQFDSPAWQIRRSVEAVAAGELWVPRLVASNLCRGFLSACDPRKLTDREEDILALLAEGQKNREIAATLHISRDTVRWHMRTIYSKLGIHDRQSAVMYAMARKLAPQQSASHSRRSLAAG